MNFFQKFVSSWGEWMTQMSLQLTLVVLLIGVLDRLLYRWVRPQLLYALWGLVFLKLLVSPDWSSSYSLAQLFDFSNPSTLKGDVPLQVAIRTSEIGAELWFFLFWIVITMVLGGFSIFRYLRQKDHYLSPNPTELPERFKSLYHALGKKLQLKVLPIVRVSEKVQSPFTLGFFKTQILLPAALVRDGNHQQLKHVLVHELTHIKKRDPQWALIQHVIQLFYWFHPAVYFASKRIRVLREVRCDYHSLEFLDQEGEQYKNTLLTLGVKVTRPNYSGVLHFGFSSSELLSRLRWLDRSNKQFGLMERLLTTSLMGLTLLCGLPLSQAESQIQDQTITVRQSSWDSENAVVEVERRVSVPSSTINLAPGDIEEAQTDLEHAQGCFQRRYVIFQLLAKENQTSDKVAFKGE